MPDQFKKLLDYYLACIEKEEERSLEVSADPRYKQFTVPREKLPGNLFRGLGEESWNTTDNNRGFLNCNAIGIDEQRFIYGYPLYRTRKGKLKPLFYTEAEISQDGDVTTLRLPHPSDIKVNLALFFKTHPMLKERVDLEHLLEGDFGTIDDRISAALEERDEKGSLKEVCSKWEDSGWKNRGIVMRDLGSHITRPLRDELGRLKEQLSSEAWKKTAMGALLRISNIKPISGIAVQEVLPLNQAQRDAVGSALSLPITVITGPPGTGKSQVVATILLSLATAGRSVLFASKNNNAVDVVRERIADLLGDADWFLRLGNKENIEKEVKAKVAQSQNVSNDESNRPLSAYRAEVEESQSKRNVLHKGIKDDLRELNHYLKLAGKFRKCVEILSADWQHWYLGDRRFLDIKTKAWIESDFKKLKLIKGGSWPGFIIWLKRLVMGDRRVQKNFADSLYEVSRTWSDVVPRWQIDQQELDWVNLEKDYRDLTCLYKLARYEELIAKSQSQLAEQSTPEAVSKRLEVLSKKIRERSLPIVKSNIINRLGNPASLPTMLKSYKEQTQEAAKLNPRIVQEMQRFFAEKCEDLFGRLPGAIVTSLSARRSLPMKSSLFDCVIIDEASQCDIASSLPLLLRAKRLVVIGDPHQLRHITTRQLQGDEQAIAAENDAAELLSDYSYCRKSLYDCAAESIEKMNCGAPFFLNEHYRSHPHIVEFSNRTYYRHRLIHRKDTNQGNLQSMFWHDVPTQINNLRKGSLLNEIEADRVVDLVQQLMQQEGFGDSSLGVVTPWKKHAIYIDQKLRKVLVDKSHCSKVEVGTVHTFQGAEADVMIFSPAIAQCNNPDHQEQMRDKARWLSCEEGLLNVALTRAKAALHIVGDKRACSEVPGPLGELANYVGEIEKAGRVHVQRPNSPACDIVRDALKKLGIWYQEEFPVRVTHGTRYLDFLVVGLSGTRYDIEVDGRQHYFSHQAIAEDIARDAQIKSMGYKVVRLRSADAIRNPDAVRSILNGIK